MSQTTLWYIAAAFAALAGLVAIVSGSMTGGFPALGLAVALAIIGMRSSDERTSGPR